VNEGVSVEIVATLTDNQDNPISGKYLHYYGVAGIEVGSPGVTDSNGQASFTYTVNAEDDGKSVKIAYLGD
jgi:hypothetical protein